MWAEATPCRPLGPAQQEGVARRVSPLSLRSLCAVRIVRSVNLSYLSPEGFGAANIRQDRIGSVRSRDRLRCLPLPRMASSFSSAPPQPHAKLAGFRDAFLRARSVARAVRGRLGTVEFFSPTHRSPCGTLWYLSLCCRMHGSAVRSPVVSGVSVLSAAYHPRMAPAPSEASCAAG
jgi:hypothetical protein